ncbi:Flp pilus assembly complex ATPase component TadA [Amphibacillus sp. MSJ-3]|uniref:competence type IV pilus ATPase ComGA n=1 Tax=Amphibacillus sp. MSJ-3 TaxID=2841505 RepID=UPI001C0ED184|nr:Flp pilus assembly complex ATPase component TadA [Amphibacillus sp. MSJ-3]
MINIFSATTFIRQLLKVALSVNATDIHFFPSSSTTSIFLRIHGMRKFHEKISINHYLLIINYLKFSAGMDIGEARKPQDGAITFQIDSSELNLRISTLPTKQNESLAIRILPKSESFKLSELLLFPYQAKQLKQCMTRKSGVTLLTGATGSGKSTLLYALLEELLKEQAYQIITLEDPIEKELFNVHQVQVNEKSGITYQSGLKSALRHDPDILMVGEIRDRETAKFVFHAAYTGHLVLTTLHAKNATGTIHRLIEMGIKPIDISQNLLAIASLELIPLTIDGRVRGRTAILELLNDQLISTYLQTFDQDSINYPSFEYLKRKAVAYGYANQNILESKPGKAPN